MIQTTDDLRQIANIPFLYNGHKVQFEFITTSFEPATLCFTSPNKYAANISRVSKKGVHWFTYFLGQEVSGIIPYFALPKPINNENQ